MTEPAPTADVAKEFRTQRIPKYLGWLETVLALHERVA